MLKIRGEFLPDLQQMNIRRDIYLDKLIDHKHNGLIKIVSGIRRCGKSYLLFELFRQHLLDDGVPPERIITLALDSRKEAKYRDPDACFAYVEEHIHGKEMHYLLLDEVQLMDDFESVLNGLLRIRNLDIYVTGSNSRFLCTDVITEFRGRGDEIRVHPLSFAEFYSVHRGDWSAAWKEYSTYGGMPFILHHKKDSDKAKYLQNLFQETYIRDLIERNRLRNTEGLEELVNIMASDISCLTNPHKLTNSFRSIKHMSLSENTVRQYLDYMQDAFLVQRAMRYDIKGKRYINTPCKYYFVDVGLRNARLNFRQRDPGHVMENIIYNELITRGYQVDTGAVDLYEKNEDGTVYARKRTEVDFVVNSGSARYYIQSTFEMPTQEKERQESRPLRKIQDAFKKIIVTFSDIYAYHNEDGILIMSLKDFLLHRHSLDE